MSTRNDWRYGSPFYMSPIDVDERIGRALCKCIFLKFGALDAGSYADTGALRAATSRTLPDVETVATSLAHVQALGRTFAWSVTDTRADDGQLVIKPDDREPDQQGRWLAAPFPDWPGPFHWHGLEFVGLIDRAVPLESRGAQPSLLTLCKGKTPAVFVSFVGKTDRTVLDQEPGAILMTTLNFQIRIISKNWRGSPSARYGSEIPEEADLDPGASALAGRIEWLLRGSQGFYGEGVPGGGYTGAAGVSMSPWNDYCRILIGNHTTGASFGQDLRLMDTLEIGVRLAVDRPNEVQDLVQLRRFYVQQQQPQPDGSALSIGSPLVIFARQEATQ